MSDADYLELGDWNADCAKCGGKFKASTMRKESAGPGLSAMFVCQKCWRPRQPQDFVRGIADNMTAPWVQQFPDKFLAQPIITERSDELIVGDDYILTELGEIIYTET